MVQGYSWLLGSLKSALHHRLRWERKGTLERVWKQGYVRSFHVQPDREVLRFSTMSHTQWVLFLILLTAYYYITFSPLREKRKQWPWEFKILEQTTFIFIFSVIYNGVSPPPPITLLLSWPNSSTLYSSSLHSSPTGYIILRFPHKNHHVILVKQNSFCVLPRMQKKKKLHFNELLRVRNLRTTWEAVAGSLAFNCSFGDWWIPHQLEQCCHTAHCPGNVSGGIYKIMTWAEPRRTFLASQVSR